MNGPVQITALPTALNGLSAVVDISAFDLVTLWVTVGPMAATYQLQINFDNDSANSNWQNWGAAFTNTVTPTLMAQLCGRHARIKCTGAGAAPTAVYLLGRIPP